eukprot:765216-Hanusia_phi.AAC.3
MLRHDHGIGLGGRALPPKRRESNLQEELSAHLVCAFQLLVRIFAGATVQNLSSSLQPMVFFVLELQVPIFTSYAPFAPSSAIPLLHHRSLTASGHCCTPHVAASSFHRYQEWAPTLRLYFLFSPEWAQRMEELHGKSNRLIRLKQGFDLVQVIESWIRPPGGGPGPAAALTELRSPGTSPIVPELPAPDLIIKKANQGQGQ